MKVKIQIFVDDINEYAKNNQLFWVCAMAKDCNAILVSQLDKLHPVAKQAVEHYMKGR